MFNLTRKRRGSTAHLDLSQILEENHHWNVSVLTSFDYLLEVTAFAIEPVSGLLAVGTTDGCIHLFGGPGVHLKLHLACRVKYLQFATSIYRLISVDDENCLHVWDLTCKSPDSPELMVSARFGRTINCVTVSPSHSHAFVALESGDVKTFDLLCLRRSPFTIPNMWVLYEDKMATSGHLVIPDPADRMPMDVVLHPRDLNLIFLVYGGGIVLFDLTRQTTLHVYEFILPPGAPGGSGYQHKNLLTHRRVPVSSLAVHPSGHVFAVGHADGCIAFWAVEDEDQPLIVRTIKAEDVNAVDGARLEAILSEKSPDGHKGDAAHVLEPIFKLSWSEIPTDNGQWGGETALTVLGGTGVNSAGVNVLWLPVVNLPDVPPSTLGQSGLNPIIRKTLRKWLTDAKTCFMPTTGIIQDFLLIPRDSPHFCGAFDPIAILFLCDSGEKSRCTEAYQFPPGVFQRSQSNAPESQLDAIDSFPHTSSRLSLPGPLLNGADGTVGGHFVRLDNDIYEQVVAKTENMSNTLPLSAGLAWTSGELVDKAKFSKFQRPELLVTHHQDLTVRFQDISLRLRVIPRSSPVYDHFPQPLPDLTIDVRSLLGVPLVASRVANSQEPRIAAVHIARESLECAVLLRNGETFIFRCHSGPGVHSPAREASDKELLILEHIARSPHCRFHPFLLLTPNTGSISAFALSDIGFVAAGYDDGSLFVVDMRTPRIILRHTEASNSKSATNRRSSKNVDPVAALTWTVATHNTVSQICIQLVAVRQSGYSEIYKVTRNSSSTSWVIDGDTERRWTVENPLRGGTFVIDRKTGATLAADRSGLEACLQTQTGAADRHGILLVAGEKVVKSISDITGDRIGKAEWATESGIIQNVSIVERMGYHALVAFTNKREIMVYSLPHLKLLHLLQGPQSSDASSVSSDDVGNFMTWVRHSDSKILSSISYASLFNSHGALPQLDIDLESTRPKVPRRPTQLSFGPTSVLSYLMKFGTSMTGENVDALLAGPDRPQPVYPVRTVTTSSSGSDDEDTTGAPQTGLYERLTSALSERGQILGDLEERFGALESGSRSMVAQAQRLAAAQKAKSWFGF